MPLCITIPRGTRCMGAPSRLRDMRRLRVSDVGCTACAHSRSRLRRNNRSRLRRKWSSSRLCDSRLDMRAARASERDRNRFPPGLGLFHTRAKPRHRGWIARCAAARVPALRTATEAHATIRVSRQGAVIMTITPRDRRARDAASVQRTARRIDARAPQTHHSARASPEFPSTHPPQRAARARRSVCALPSRSLPSRSLPSRSLPSRSLPSRLRGDR